MSHLWKKKIVFPITLVGDILVSRRVSSVRSLPGPGQYAIQRSATEAVVDKAAQFKTAPKPVIISFLFGGKEVSKLYLFLGEFLIYGS